MEFRDLVPMTAFEFPTGYARVYYSIQEYLCFGQKCGTRAKSDWDLCAKRKTQNAKSKKQNGKRTKVTNKPPSNRQSISQNQSVSQTQATKATTPNQATNKHFMPGHSAP
jgi:hypothetical protein